MLPGWPRLVLPRSCTPTTSPHGTTPFTGGRGSKNRSFDLSPRTKGAVSALRLEPADVRRMADGSPWWSAHPRRGSSARAAVRDRLSFVVWIETPRHPASCEAWHATVVSPKSFGRDG